MCKDRKFPLALRPATVDCNANLVSCPGVVPRVPWRTLISPGYASLPPRQAATGTPGWTLFHPNPGDSRVIIAYPSPRRCRPGI